LVLNNENVK